MSLSAAIGELFARRAIAGIADDPVARAKPVTPGPTLSTMPANSAPGENGKAGLYWYFPAMISVSKKLSAAASTRTTASPGPATGSGRSPSSRSSGVPARVQRMAFMAR